MAHDRAGSASWTPLPAPRARGRIRPVFSSPPAALHELPEPGLPEVAFVGRSNAGKSSAINALAQHRRLAFASKTPGRTQHINLFALGPAEAPDAIWVDLPGYGFAAVEREAKQRWQAVVADYLAQRRSSPAWCCWSMRAMASRRSTGNCSTTCGRAWPAAMCTCWCC